MCAMIQGHKKKRKEKCSMARIITELQIYILVKCSELCLRGVHEHTQAYTHSTNTHEIAAMIIAAGII